MKRYTIILKEIGVCEIASNDDVISLLYTKGLEGIVVHSFLCRNKAITGHFVYIRASNIIAIIPID